MLKLMKITQDKLDGINNAFGTEFNVDLSALHSFIDRNEYSDDTFDIYE